MARKPFFSIVIPTYNRAEDLMFALYCIFQQSFINFEVIISDNCSTDNTKKSIQQLMEKRIRYFKNKENIDFVSNVGKAVSYAKGKYIFLHSDDDFMLYADSLDKIYKDIKKTKAGYIRLNYICLSPDKKKVFHFKVNKQSRKNIYLKSHLQNSKILAFIMESDPYFITGIIFKNGFSKYAQIVDADPSPWIEILFYVTSKFGAYFIARRNIVASWSQWRNKKGGNHPLFSLSGGRLKSENFFEVVKGKVSKKEYEIFLHKHLMMIFVTLFPVIKVIVGNQKMMAVAKRVNYLDPGMKGNPFFWIYLLGSLVTPAFILKKFKDSYLYIYARFSRVENNNEILNRLVELDNDFLISRENVFSKKTKIFKF